MYAGCPNKHERRQLGYRLWFPIVDKWQRLYQNKDLTSNEFFKMWFALFLSSKLTEILKIWKISLLNDKLESSKFLSASRCKYGEQNFGIPNTSRINYWLFQKFQIMTLIINKKV